MNPENCDAVCPDTEPMEYEYVPFGTENVIVSVVDDSVVLLNSRPRREIIENC